MYARSAASGSDAGDVPLHRLAKGSDSSTGSAWRASANLQSLQRPDGQQLSITDFEVLSKIGEGGFGTVLLVRKRSTGKLYALKVLVKKSMRRTGDARRAISESAAMQEIKHPFVVTLHFAFQDERHVYFALEFVGGGDLYSHLERQTFSEDWARVYIAEIAMAIAHVHSHDFVYRDLKPENILVAHDGHLKLADFGLAKKLNMSVEQASGGQGGAGEGVGRGRLNTMIGTMAFSAPEMFLEQDYGKSVDWWALGLLLCEMITGDLPLVGLADESMGARVESFRSGKHLKPLPRTLSREASDLIVRLLTVQTGRRMCCGPTGFDELKGHAFFAGLDWERLLRRELDAPLKPLLAPGGVAGGGGGGEGRSATHAPSLEEEELVLHFGHYVGEDEAVAASRYAASAALCEAAAHSDLAALRAQLQGGTDVNCGDYDRRTPLHLAASEGLLEVVRFLVVEAGADASPVDRWGGTPLDDAIRSHHQSVVELLFAHGGKKGALPLRRASSSLSATSAEVCDAAARGDLQRLRALREGGTDLDCGDYDKRTALHLAASEGLLGVVQYLLLEAGCAVNPTDRWGGTPLDDALRANHAQVAALLAEHGGIPGAKAEGAAELAAGDATAELIDAASKGDLHRLRALVARGGADPSAGDYDRRTALHLAASEGRLPVVEFLVDEAHAAVNPVDRWGGTPLDDALRAKQPAIASYLRHKGGFTASKLLQTSRSAADHSMSLCDAAAQDNAMAIRVLVAQGADVNSGDYDKRTALHLAASNGHLQTVRLLLTEAKTEANPLDRWGGTPLDDALRSKHQDVADYLLRHGAERGTRQDATIADLCNAAARGDTRAVREFVAQGVDPNGGDYDRRTPLHLAASEGLLAVVQLLLGEARAEANPVDRWGGTPLDDALRHGHAAAVELLRAKGGRSGRGALAAVDKLMAADDGREGGARACQLRAEVHAAALCSLAAAGRLAELRELVGAQGFSAELADYDRRTALHLAACEGRAEVARYLLGEARAHASPADRFGRTPLDEALRCGHAAVAELLRGAGAKPSARHAEPRAREAATAALCAAAARGDVDGMRGLLAQHGPALAGCADYDQRTALHLAACGGSLAACSLLVDEAKVDASPSDRYERTPLDDAERYARAEVAAFLRGRGARHGPGRPSPCLCAIS